MVATDLGSIIYTVVIGVIVTLLVNEISSYKRHGKEALRRLYEFLQEKQAFQRCYVSLKAGLSWLMSKVHE